MKDLPRIIPCLLLSGSRLVKTTRFRAPCYVGDPINTLHIFNEKEVDEIMLLDIEASRQRRGPNLALLEDLASECFVPLSYGGGVTSVEQAAAIFKAGVEKVVINSAAFKNPELISDIAARFGNQSVVAAIDVRKNFMGRYKVYSVGGSKRQSLDPEAYAAKAVAAGAGEIMITSIDREGSFAGYDLSLVRAISSAVNVPIIASGGAGHLKDIKDVVETAGASAVAVGSMFVFQGARRGVLVNYPSRHEIEALF